MLRIAILAASAAIIGAAPAYAASVRISTAGKTPEQVKAEVIKAAVHLCRIENRGSGVTYQLQDACIHDTVRDALAQTADPALGKVATR